MKIYIYKITNTVNGKIYIGKTVHTPEARFKSHKSEARRNLYDTYFHRAIRKYGEDSFVIEVIETVDLDESLAYERERALVQEHGCVAPHGYNSHEGGKGGMYNPAPMVRAKLSHAKKGKSSPNKGKGIEFLLTNKKTGKAYRAKGVKNFHELCKCLNIRNSKKVLEGKDFDWSVEKA